MLTENPDPAATTDNISASPVPGKPAQEETLPPGTESAAGPAPLSAAELAKLGFPNIPGYDLVEELGRGAMGVVFKAVQFEPNRLVGLKTILSGMQAGTAHVQTLA